MPSARKQQKMATQGLVPVRPFLHFILSVTLQYSRSVNGGAACAQPLHGTVTAERLE